MSTNRSGNLNQVMQQAVWDSATRVPEGDIRALKHRIHALEGEVIGYKQILDAQPEQEPVAWMVYTQEGQSVYVTDNPTDLQESQRALPLYTTPPQRTWVGLTKDEVEILAYKAEGNTWIAVELTETKIKEKNT